MAMNYEFERHIQAASQSDSSIMKSEGVEFLHSLRLQFNIAVKMNLVPELSMGTESTDKEVKSGSVGGESSESSIGSLLRNYRESLMLTQKELSSLSGTAMETISRIESGKSFPHQATVKGILRAIGLEQHDIRSLLLEKEYAEQSRLRRLSRRPKSQTPKR